MLLTIYYVIIQKKMSPRKLEEGVMINFINLRKGRSSPSQMFFKIGVPTNFSNLIRKTPVWGSLFNKVTGFFLQNASGGCFWKGSVKELA